MKNAILKTLLLLLIFCTSDAFSAELLDVKPLPDGAVEITSDIAMTYTFYKIPGQPRTAVVDIADADPEKVEPLIVVNKGAVSSISVDKVQISGMLVSRSVFNLMSDAEISVTATPDRKKLTVSFAVSGTSSAASAGNSATPPKASPAEPPAPSVPSPAPQAAQESKAVPASSPQTAKNEEEDPLGLDDPPSPPLQTQKQPPAAQKPVVESPAPLPAAARPVKSVPVPVVLPPDSTLPSSPVISSISAGNGYIEIFAGSPVNKFRTMRLNNPERLAIDISNATTNMKRMASQINRFGIDKVRVGVYSDYVRIVLDTRQQKFPEYQISASDKGLRIFFK